MTPKELRASLRNQESSFKRARTLCQNQAKQLRRIIKAAPTPAMGRYYNSMATVLEGKVVALDKLIKDCQELQAMYEKEVETIQS
jgi:uncharacterized protein YqgV (UPF0045/DUF77 family)